MPKKNSQEKPDKQENLSDEIVDLLVPKKSKSKSKKASGFDKEKFLSSRKFIAYLVAVNVGLVGFIVLYYQSKEVKLFIEYLDFVLWSLVAYTGGNAVNKMSERLRK